MKCLVTGGAGFIGSHLVEKLLATGYQVRVLDDFSTGSRENLRAVLENKSYADCFELIEGDLRDNAVCLDASREASLVFHLAAMTSVPDSFENVAQTNEVNISGFVNILQAAVANRVHRFIYSSSSAVYGNHTSLPATETQLCQPSSPYGLSKVYNELYAGLISAAEEINCIGLRYFNVYGPRQSSDGLYASVIATWLNALVSDSSINIYGDGSNTRDFSFVADVVEANLLAARAQVDNDIMNIASGDSISLIELYEVMVRIYQDMGFHFSGAEKYLSPRKGDIEHSSADITLAGHLLGFVPATELQVGLRKLIESKLKEIS